MRGGCADAGDTGGGEAAAGPGAGAQDPHDQCGGPDEAGAGNAAPAWAERPRLLFAFHGYPWLIHRLAYRRANHDNLHVRGYKEEGTITTPFDMAVLNELDRFHLVSDTIDRLPQLGARAGYIKQAMREKLIEHRQYIRQAGEDMPEILNWRWLG